MLSANIAKPNLQLPEAPRTLMSTKVSTKSINVRSVIGLVPNRSAEMVKFGPSSFAARASQQLDPQRAIGARSLAALPISSAQL